MARGRFIAFEGLDGAGISTQARMLHERLSRAHVPCNRSGEPTKGPIGAVIRQWLRHRVDLDQATLAALFAADRLDHLYNPVDGLEARLVQGVTEITVRYLFSSLAYQSVELDMDWIAELNRKALLPDAVVYLQIAPEESYRRIVRRQTQDEVFESVPYLEQVAANFERALARFERKTTILRVDASRPADVVAEDVWNQICQSTPIHSEQVLPLWSRRPSKRDTSVRPSFAADPDEPRQGGHR